LKVIYYNIFYCRSILVVLCRAVAITRPESEGSTEKNFAPLMKSGHFALKIVIKKEKILKIKPQTANNRHHAFVAVCYSLKF